MSVQGTFATPQSRIAITTSSRVVLALGNLRRYKVLTGLFVGAVLLATVYFLFGQTGTVSGTPMLFSATRGDVENIVTAIGTLQPFNTVDVGAQVSGQLKTLHVKIGDQVRAGDLVAEIDSTVAAAKVDADTAQLQNLQAQLLDKQASLVLTTAQAGRQTRLNALNATSQDIYDSALAAQRSSEAQVKAVQAQIDQAHSTLKADQATLGYAKIYAPMTGTVTAIPAKQGQTLNANQQAPTILTISDLASMTVYTQVSEADVSKLHIGMDVYFTTLGNSNRRFIGKLRQILPTPTTVNNVVLYTALFDVTNAGGQLMSQMTAQVFFVLGAAHGVVTVPVAALKYAAAATHAARSSATPRRNATVVVVPPSGVNETRNVVVGVANRVDAEIVSGLSVGEVVIAGLKSSSAKPAQARSTPGGQGGGQGGGPGGGGFGGAGP